MVSSGIKKDFKVNQKYSSSFQNALHNFKNELHYSRI